MAFVQASAPGTTSLSLTEVKAGNSVLVLIAQYTSAIRTYAVADDIVGSYTVDKAYQDNHHVAVHSFHNHPGGDITITVTPSSGANFRAVAIEVSGLDAAAAPISSDFTDAENTYTHFSAQVGAIDTAGPAFIVCAGTLSSVSGVSGTTAGTGYTKIDSGNLVAFFQYMDAPSAVTDERGQWTHSGGSARIGRSVIVAYPALLGGGEPEPTKGQLSFAEFAVPNLPTRGRLSFAELGTPSLATKGRLAVAELEAPLVPTKGQLSFAELEAPLVPTRGLLARAEFETPYAPARGFFSHAEFEAPEPAAATKGLLSHAELEAPNVTTAGRLTHAEFEVPNLPTKGRVSAAYLEAPFLKTKGRLSFAEMEAPLVPTRGLLSFVQFEAGTAPAAGRLSQAFVAFPEEGEILVKQFSHPDKLRFRRRREHPRLHR